MKVLLFTILLTVGVTVIWNRYGQDIINVQYTIKKETLDLSVPFSDTIDVELLNEFKRPMESSATF